MGPAKELECRLVAVAIRDPSPAREFAEKHGIERVLDSYSEVVSDPQVDVVYNPLANALHAPWNLAAVAAGKPVLTEKPFARNRAGAQHVHHAARDAGITVMEGFPLPVPPVTQRMYDLAGSGELGELRHVEVGMAMPAPDASDPRWSLQLAGGALMDLGCYGLHVMHTLGKLLGARPTVVAARASQRGPGVDEWCDVDLAFPGGVTGRATNSIVAKEHSFTLRVVGTTGEAFAHNFIKPHDDDRVTMVSPAGSRVERLGTRPSSTIN